MKGMKIYHFPRIKKKIRCGHDFNDFDKFKSFEKILSFELCKKKNLTRNNGKFEKSRKFFLV